MIEKIKKCILENINRDNYEVRVDRHKKSGKLSVFCIGNNNRTSEEYNDISDIIYSISVDTYDINEFCNTENDLKSPDDEDMFTILKNDPSEFVNMYFDEDSIEEFENNLTEKESN